MCRVTDASWLLGFWFSALLAFCVPIGMPAAGVQAQAQLVGRPCRNYLMLLRIQNAFQEGKAEFGPSE